jgi:hypothetical protein
VEAGLIGSQTATIICSVSSDSDDPTSHPRDSFVRVRQRLARDGRRREDQSVASPSSVLEVRRACPCGGRYGVSADRDLGRSTNRCSTGDQQFDGTHVVNRQGLGVRRTGTRAAHLPLAGEP